MNTIPLLSTDYVQFMQPPPKIGPRFERNVDPQSEFILSTQPLVIHKICSYLTHNKDLSSFLRTCKKFENHRQKENYITLFYNNVGQRMPICLESDSSHNKPSCFENDVDIQSQFKKDKPYIRLIDLFHFVKTVELRKLEVKEIKDLNPQHNLNIITVGAYVRCKTKVNGKCYFRIHEFPQSAFYTKLNDEEREKCFLFHYEEKKNEKKPTLLYGTLSDLPGLCKCMTVIGKTPYAAALLSKDKESSYLAFFDLQQYKCLNYITLPYRAFGICSSGEKIFVCSAQGKEYHEVLLKY